MIIYIIALLIVLLGFLVNYHYHKHDDTLVVIYACAGWFLTGVVSTLFFV